MDCIAHGVSKSWLQLSDLHFTSLLSHQEGPMQSQRPSQVERGEGDGKASKQDRSQESYLTLCGWL